MGEAPRGAAVTRLNSERAAGRVILRQVELGTIRAGACVVLSLSLGCGASRTRIDEVARGDRMASDAGMARPDAAEQPAAERPFASTPLEAQRLIQEQIDSRISVLWKCVEDHRTVIGDAHKAIVFDVGIDQEGHLLGVAAANPKAGALAPSVKDCILRALRAARFPRSHAGVIAVRQTFQDTPVYR
jgi:hypothetical protein